MPNEGGPCCPLPLQGGSGAWSPVTVTPGDPATPPPPHLMLHGSPAFLFLESNSSPLHPLARYAFPRYAHNRPGASAAALEPGLPLRRAQASQPALGNRPVPLALTNPYPVQPAHPPTSKPSLRSFRHLPPCIKHPPTPVVLRGRVFPPALQTPLSCCLPSGEILPSSPHWLFFL